VDNIGELDKKDYQARKRQETFLLAVVMLLAFFLRLKYIRGLSLSNDELSALIRLRFDTYAEMMRNYMDGHPAGVQAFLFYWVKIFGESALTLRMPFLLFGTFSTLLIYLLGKRWFSAEAGLLAAAVYSVSPLILVTTDLARMYSPGVFFSVLAALYWTYFLFPKERIKKRYWLIITLSAAACIHVHYFCGLFIGLLFLTGLFYLKAKNAVAYFSAFIIAALTFIPELPLFVRQLNIADVGAWLSPPPNTFLYDFIFEVFMNSWVYMLIVLFMMIAGYLLSRQNKHQNHFRIISLSWFMLSFIIGYVYSQTHPVLQYTSLVFTLPFFLLFLFSYNPFTGMKRPAVFIAIFILAISTKLLSSGFYSTRHFGDFKTIAAEVSKLHKENNYDPFFVINTSNPDYYEYYRKEFPFPEQKIIYTIEAPEDFRDLARITDTCTSQYFGFAWCNAAHPHQVLSAIQSAYPYLIEKKIFFNSAIYLFSKKPGKQLYEPLLSSVCDYENHTWQINDSASTEKYFSSNHSEKMNHNKSATYISALKGSGQRVIYVSARIFALEDLKDAKFVITFSKNGKEQLTRGRWLSDYNPAVGRWETVIFADEIPENSFYADSFSVHIENPSATQFFIDDLKVALDEADNPYTK
jgi:hypothetical protein